MKGKVDLLLMGSSHFSPHHFFEKAFLESCSDREIGDIVIKASPGRFLNPPHVRLMTDYVEKLDPIQSLIINIMMSCNAICRYHHAHDMVSTHLRVIKSMEKHANVRIILCGSIPEVKSHPAKYDRVDSILYDLDQNFRIIANAHPSNTMFFDTASILRYRSVVGTNFDTKQVLNYENMQGVKTFLYQDKIHLNRLGANVLATSIHFFLKNVAIPFWFQSQKSYHVTATVQTPLPSPLNVSD